MDQEKFLVQSNTWYCTPRKACNIWTQDINPDASHTFTGSQDAGMYTCNELKGFWDSILVNAASRTDFKKFSQSPIVYTTDQERTEGSHYYPP